MARPSNPFDLSAIYREAEALTRRAELALRAGDKGGAYQLLEHRVQLVRSIQRFAPETPPWGTRRDLDEAALSYLAADRQLEGAIEALC